MAALFSTPKMPEVKQVTPEYTPPAPVRSAEDTQQLASDQRRKFANRGGRSSTMLTGGAGTGGGVSAIRFLGGAART